MSHDLYASWATAELANQACSEPQHFFLSPPNSTNISASASREGNKTWPISDGVLHIDLQPNNSYSLAVELKRENEGLHGVLTAIGQSQAYIHKGFLGSVIVIPQQYSSHLTPGNHVSEILDRTTDNLPVGVFTYKTPDTTMASPFSGKLTCCRAIQLDEAETPEEGPQAVTSRITTQWGHMREGSSDAHAFFLYLEKAKRLSPRDPDVDTSWLPTPLANAVARLAPTTQAKDYLSYSKPNSFHDKVWRAFWFSYVFNERTAPIWRDNITPLTVNDTTTGILIRDNTYKVFFAGRSDSPKNKCVEAINNGSWSINEAWEKYAKKVHDRAHSYREDIDSGLDALGFLASDGKPSDLGYRFVDQVERSGTVFSGAANGTLGAALLRNADYAAFLHYVYRVSASRFQAEPLAFTDQDQNFKRSEYLGWLADELANNLKVMRTVSRRGGQQRQPFQAELAVLRKFNFVDRFRLGVGLEINWPKVHEYLETDISC